MLKNILDKLLFKQKYNYVPPCPRCHSFRTGYVIEGQHTERNEQIKVKRMEMGEIVHVHAFLSDDHNLFCENCGLNWQGEIEKKYLTLEEIDKEKEKRGIDEEYIFDRNFTKMNIRNLAKRVYKEEKRKAQGKESNKNKKTKKCNKNVKIKMNDNNTKKEKNVKIKK